MRELESLLREIVPFPSAPVLLTDNDRRHLQASFGASKLLGHPRERIIGRKLDDFIEPNFKPVMSERWCSFLEEGAQEGTQEGTLPLMRRSGYPKDSAKGNLLPLRHLLVLRERDIRTAADDVKAAQRVLPRSVPAWVQDYALFLLDADEKIVAWYGARSASMAIPAHRWSANRYPSFFQR